MSQRMLQLDRANGAAVSEAVRCTYKGRQCFNEQAIKVSGERHRFCHAHRLRANATQRKHRRTKRQSSIGSADDSSLLDLCEPARSPTSAVALKHANGAEDGVLAPSAELKCKYGKGLGCRNVRATKANGDLHSLCPRHRVEANKYQRKHTDKKKQRLMEEVVPTITTAGAVGAIEPLFASTTPVRDLVPLDLAMPQVSTFVDVSASIMRHHAWREQIGDVQRVEMVNYVSDDSALADPVPLMSMPGPCWNDSVVSSLNESTALRADTEFEMLNSDLQPAQATALLQARGFGAITPPIDDNFQVGGFWKPHMQQEDMSTGQFAMLADNLSTVDAKAIGSAVTPLISDWIDDLTQFEPCGRFEDA